MENTISLKEAQEAIILSQGLYKKQGSVSDQDTTYNVIKSVNYIQIDSLSVVERAHHHSIWNRTENYNPTQLESLLEDKKIFEYWSHAAAYLPMVDYRYSLPRKNGFRRGDERWFKIEEKTMSLVLDRIKIDGQLQAKDFKDLRNNKTGLDKRGNVKNALDQLFFEGKIMIAKRDSFHKVFDLTERVLPPNIDTSVPTEDEYFQHSSV